MFSSTRYAKRKTVKFLQTESQPLRINVSRTGTQTWRLREVYEIRCYQGHHQAHIQAHRFVWMMTDFPQYTHNVRMQAHGDTCGHFAAWHTIACHSTFK